MEHTQGKLDLIEWLEEHIYHTTTCDKHRRNLGNPCICGKNKAIEETEKLKKQAALLTLGLLQEKQKTADLLAACKMLVIFADEILPQARHICFDIGNLNNALIIARPAIAKAET